VRSTRAGLLTLQAIVATIGTVVVIVGIILIPFPGPGWLIVLAGLAILAAEFVWAQRLLKYTRSQLETWWHWLGRQHILIRVLVGAASLAFVTGVVLLSLRISLGVRSVSDIWDLLE
jgi:uncharacterized protein (TIGR02611 family)